MASRCQVDLGAGFPSSRNAFESFLYKYASLCFFPAYWAFNIQWRERPERRIDSYAEPKGRWVADQFVYASRKSDS